MGNPFKNKGTLKASTTLTASAVVMGTLQNDDYNQLTLMVNYTTGAAETNNVLSIVVEASNDNTTFYNLATEAVSAGVVTLSNRRYDYTGASAGTSYKFTLDIPNAYYVVRVSAYETGVAANFGTVAIEYYRSSQI